MRSRLTAAADRGARSLAAVLAVLADVLARSLRTGVVRSTWRTTTWLVIASLLGEMLYGAVMGAFGQRPVQVLYSSLKVPLLLDVTFCIGLPNFFIINNLLGLRSDFKQTMAAMLSAQAAMAVTLISLAPITAFWYCSSDDYDHAILFNGLVFALATLASQMVLRRVYRPLIALNPMHRRVLGGWLVLFTFIAIQMAWVLRPFVGNPLQPPQFLRTGAWSNAYVFVGGLVWRFLQL